jgi:hypothetical protein
VATWQAQLLTRQLDDLSLLLARFLMTPPSVNAQFILSLLPEESQGSQPIECVRITVDYIRIKHSRTSKVGVVHTEGEDTGSTSAFHWFLAELSHRSSHHTHVIVVVTSAGDVAFRFCELLY